MARGVAGGVFSLSLGELFDRFEGGTPWDLTTDAGVANVGAHACAVLRMALSWADARDARGFALADAVRCVRAQVKLHAHDPAPPATAAGEFAAYGADAVVAALANLVFLAYSGVELEQHAVGEAYADFLETLACAALLALRIENGAFFHTNVSGMEYAIAVYQDKHARRSEARALLGDALHSVLGAKRRSRGTRANADDENPEYTERKRSFLASWTRAHSDGLAESAAKRRS